MRRHLRFALLLALPLAACSGGTGDSDSHAGGTGQLTLEVTDKPLDHDLVEEAVVRIDRVRIHVEADVDDAADGGWRTLYEGQPREFDLIELRDGLTGMLVNGVELPAGTYRQLRLRVASGHLLLKNGNLYTSDDGSLHLGSTATSGFKAFIDPPLTVTDGVSEHLLLDVDLTKTFKPIPANDPENATKFNLHPVVRLANLSETGELRGTVLRDNGAGSIEPVADATVYVLPEGLTSPDDSVASTASAEDGSFTVRGLDPDVYDLLGIKDSERGLVWAVQVEAGSVTEVELYLE